MKLLKRHQLPYLLAMLIIACTNVGTSLLTFETQGFAATFSPTTLTAIVEQQAEQTNAFA